MNSYLEINTFPEKWWLKCDNQEQLIILNRWIIENSNCNYSVNGSSSCGFFYPNFHDFNGFNDGYHTGELLKTSPYNQYTAISFEQFKTQY